MPSWVCWMKCGAVRLKPCSLAKADKKIEETPKALQTTPKADGKEIEIKVPVLGESITEATIGKWLKEEGESISVDEPIVELETDKVSVEIPSPVNGAMGKMLVKEGEVVNIDAVVATVKEGGQGSSSVAEKTQDTPTPAANKNVTTSTAATASPASAKMMAEKNVNPDNVDGSGKRGQILKGDVISALDREERQEWHQGYRQRR